MAYIEIPEGLINVGKAIKREIFSLIRDDLIDHENRITELSQNAAPVEVFNTLLLNASSAKTLTGVTFYRAVSPFILSTVQIEIFSKGLITSGQLTVDVRRSVNGLGGTFTSVLSTLPTIDFATDPDYKIATGILSTTNQVIAQGDILRLDVVNLPSTPLGKFRVLVYGNV